MSRTKRELPMDIDGDKVVVLSEKENRTMFDGLIVTELGIIRKPNNDRPKYRSTDGVNYTLVNETKVFTDSEPTDGCNIMIVDDQERNKTIDAPIGKAALMAIHAKGSVNYEPIDMTNMAKDVLKRLDRVLKHA